MGKIYKKLNNVKEALAHFNAALDLKPPTSDINLIKVRLPNPTAPAVLHLRSHATVVFLHLSAPPLTRPRDVNSQNAIEKIHTSETAEDEEI